MIGSLGLLLISDTILSIYKLISKFQNSTQSHDITDDGKVQEYNPDTSINITTNPRIDSSNVSGISFKFYHSISKVRPE